MFVSSRIRWSSLLSILLLLVGCVSNSSDRREEYKPSNVDPRWKRAERLESMRPFPVVGEAVSYPSALGVHQGWLAVPQTENDCPGIIMIHEWWGLNDNVKREAELLAGNGYVVLAVDLYGGKVAETPDQAKEYKAAVNDDEALTTMHAGVTFLTRRPEIKKQPIGCIGWCFGGRKSEQLAIADSRIRACVMYYGTPVTEAAEVGRINGAVLGIFGAEDKSISIEEVNQLRDGLALAGVPSEVHVFEGVGHAFANPSNKAGYSSEAAEEARKLTRAFLYDELGTGLVTGW